MKSENESGSNISKLWIYFEYMILRTDFLKTIHFTNFDILLKAFQNFFMMRNTTISAEEIFEAIEYELIIQIKNHNEKFYPSQIEKLAEIYVIYGKNLEGSLELYNLFIQKILTRENLKQLSKYSSNLFTVIFFSSVLIKTFVIPSSNKNFQKFLESIEEIFENIHNNQEMKSLFCESKIDAQIISNWCKLEMTKRKNRFL